MRNHEALRRALICGINAFVDALEADGESSTDLIDRVEAPSQLPVTSKKPTAARRRTPVRAPVMPLGKPSDIDIAAARKQLRLLGKIRNQ